MVWVKFTGNRQKSGDYINLAQYVINISRKSWQRLKHSKSFDVYYDLDKRAIRLTPSISVDGIKVRVAQKKYPSIYCNLFKLGMPRGLYWWDKKEDVFLFK